MDDAAAEDTEGGQGGLSTLLSSAPTLHTPDQNELTTEHEEHDLRHAGNSTATGSAVTRAISSASKLYRDAKNTASSVFSAVNCMRSSSSAVVIGNNKKDGGERRQSTAEARRGVDTSVDHKRGRVDAGGLKTEEDDGEESDGRPRGGLKTEGLEEEDGGGKEVSCCLLYCCCKYIYLLHV